MIARKKIEKELQDADINPMYVTITTIKGRRMYDSKT
jgi:hypothetical protein